MNSQNLFSIGQSTAEWSERAGLATWFESETTSTNLVAKENPLSENPMIELYVTDHQTAGRGRGDHEWNEGQDADARFGGSLLSSWVFPRASVPSPILSPLVGLAVMRAFYQTWPFLPWSLKAPNDLYLQDKKVAGLLIENVQAQGFQRFVIGLGVNVFTQPSLATATHLAEQLRQHDLLLQITEQDWHQLLDRLLLEFTLVASRSESQLSVSDRASLLWALNRFPLLKEKYSSISEEGSLSTSTKIIHWSEL